MAEDGIGNVADFKPEETENSCEKNKLLRTVDYEQESKIKFDKFLKKMSQNSKVEKEMSTEC